MKPKVTPRARRVKDTGGDSRLAPPPQSAVFPVVAVGASAGGLEAFQELLAGLSEKTGMAFVLLQHLDPKHPSLLAELIARATRMPVAEASQGANLLPDHVYVLPHNKALSLSGNTFRLKPRSDSHGQHLPIDFFMKSLAEERKDCAIGVVLSGTASDGTAGLEEIKAEGGITFAQHPNSAKFGGMPHSAITAGTVDFVLSPAEIAKELVRIGRHPYLNRSKPMSEAPVSTTDNHSFEKIVALLRNVNAVDFFDYKPATIQRRVLRRMALQKLHKPADYVAYLEEHPEEIQNLHQDLLIPMTSFFRNPSVFEALKRKVFPRIDKRRQAGQPIRIWATACSGGEETYSLAMALLEFLGEKASSTQIQIFGTDLSEAAITRARAGLYGENILESVSPERLRRFFVKEESGYRIAKTIRDMCVFARHNLLDDPPFSQMDLVSCRNLLIYLNSAGQKKVVPFLHYALKPTGFLLLGASEGTTAFPQLFAPVDQKCKIYAKKPITGRAHFDFTTARVSAPHTQLAPNLKLPDNPDAAGFDAERAADRVVLTSYAPAGVIIDGNLEVIQFRGRTSPYLEPAPGKASLNLLRMAREGLAAPLRAGVKEAAKKGSPVRKENVPIGSSGGGNQFVNIDTIPLRNAGERSALFLILFETVKQHKERGQKEPKQSEAAGGRLARELAATKDTLRSVIEEYEGAREEFQAANEEVTSSNEELQSTNEELETTKEELQSGNEELTTVNDELRSRNLELTQTNNDLANLLSSSQIPIIMLSGDLLIRRFTPAAIKVFHIVASDVGRPITDLKSKIKVPDLEQLIVHTSHSLETIEREVQDQDDRWWSLHIRPYRTTDNVIDGAVLALVDIDIQKRASEQFRKAQEYSEAIVETVREPFLVLDSQLRVQKTNASFLRTFKVRTEAIQGKLLYRLGNQEWDIPKLRAALERVFSNPEDVIVDFEVEHDFPTVGHKVMLLNARQVVEHARREPLVLLAIEDITDRKRSESALRITEKLAGVGRMAASLAHEINNPLESVVNLLYLAQSDPTASETVRQHLTAADEELRRIGHLTKQTLGLYREPAIPKDVRPAEIVDELLRIFAPRFKNKGIHVEKEIRVDGEVKAIPVELRQVLSNLLTNSIDAVGLNGKIRIRVTGVAPSGNAPRRRIRFTVADNGAGIPAEHIARIFEPFFTTKPEVGTGLGLWVSKDIVKRKGGTIAVRSCTIPGRSWTVFSICWPSENRDDSRHGSQGGTGRR